MEHLGNGYRRLNGQFATPDGGLSQVSWSREAAGGLPVSVAVLTS